MLNIFKSNKMETLMDTLVSLLDQVPDNPMIPEWIGIQSRGMKQWISLKIAGEMGICANVDFLFPRQIVDSILTNFAPLKDQEDLLTQDVLFWSVIKLIKENVSSKNLSGIENYIKDDKTGKKLYQLSMKIGKVFDDYQVYRPLMLLDWQSHKPLLASDVTSNDPAALWQAELWQKIVSKDPQNHLASKVNFFLETFSLNRFITDQLPPRISFFGISALPPVFLQVFEKVSEIIDINLFLLTPSNQYFFDIKSERQLGRIALKEESGADTGLSYHEMTNPLLSSLGDSAKGFHSILESFDYQEPPGDLFSDPLDTSSTMLSHLQSDILNLIHRKKDGETPPVTIFENDISISIHACHSPMRETHVLKDLLLREFEKDPELDPHDIIVMMPDIEAYAPFINSVFALEQALSFSISDRRKKSESEPLEAFLKILALKSSRLEQGEVLDLLLSESIAQKFSITTDEISLITIMVENANIYWGLDADHRKTLGLPAFEENTWEFGLQRLFMGMAMPENHEELVQGILPCPSFEGVDLDAMGKFACFCHTLFSCLKSLAGEKTIEKWCESLKKISHDLMERNLNNNEDLTFLIQVIDQVRQDAETTGFDKKISFDMIFCVVEQKLDITISQGNFLAGNITFCNIMPMRSIPYKIVVLMGMDEKSFPRQAFKPGFNLMKKYPMPGDKIERDDDRYLFLETLLSARSNFIITYTGMSIKDNSIIPCAGVVSELMETMDQSFTFPKGYTYHFFHPLHPFNETYFDPDSLFFSFSKDNCNIAKALSIDSSEIQTKSLPAFVQTTLVEDFKEAPQSLTLDEIIRFFKNPVQVFMTEGLDIKMQAIEDQGRDREVFSISGLDQYSLGRYLIEKKYDDLSQTDLYPVLRGSGSLPLGEKGKFEFEKVMDMAEPVLAAAKNLMSKNKLPPLVKKLMIDSLTVSGNLPDIREDGLYFLDFGKLNGNRLLSGWIRHLFLNVCGSSDYPKKTVLIGRDPKGKKAVLKCLFPPLESEAKKYLEQLVQFYARGIQTPFYFFSETSWQFICALSKKGFELTRENVLDAMGKSKTYWYGGFYQTGEIENRYISLCTENNDPFESVDAMLSSGFAQNSVIVYKPLLENLKIIS